MPLTLGDVLDTLSDPVALDIEFYVETIHIKGEYLTTVRDHIRAGNILVQGGDRFPHANVDPGDGYLVRTLMDTFPGVELSSCNYWPACRSGAFRVVLPSFMGASA